MMFSKIIVAGGGTICYNYKKERKLCVTENSGSIY